MKNKGIVTLFRVLIAMVIVAEIWSTLKGIFDVFDNDSMKGGMKFYTVVCGYLLGMAGDLMLPIFCYVFAMLKFDAPIIPSVNGGGMRPAAYPMQMGQQQMMQQRPQGMPGQMPQQGMPQQGMPGQMPQQGYNNQQWPRQ